MHRVSPASHRPRHLSGGFTLIELMIAIAVAALLAMVAFPSYLSSVRKGRRSEAVAALTWIQQAEERFRANNTTYSDDLVNAPPNGLGPPPSGSGYYNYSIDYKDLNGTSYIATATAVAGKSQASDTNCAVMRLQIVGGTVSYGSCQAGCALVAPPNGNLVDTGKCWSR